MPTVAPRTPSPGAGTLVLAATPIGEARDASPRLTDELATADVVAAEDTRRLQRLLARLGVRTAAAVLSYHEHNEQARIPEILRYFARGARVVLVTDAGMPSVSDPGYRLVRAAIAAGVGVTCLPGPSAVLAALAVSGLPADRFCFEGFLPRKAGERARALAGLAHERRTLVLFEAPHRLRATLAALAAAFGADRPAAVCRELTKTHEEVVRGPLAELAEWAAAEVRGEITLVVAGAPDVAGDPAAAVEAVAAQVAAGVRLKEACRSVAAATGLSPNGLYEAFLSRRGGPSAH